MKEIKICVVGLGYVGLPLARLFSTKYPTVGFDMNQKRVDALMAGHDATLEVADDLLQDAINNHGFVCTTDMDRCGEPVRPLVRLLARATLWFMNQQCIRE